MVHVGIKDNYTLDIQALKKCINKNTIAVVASAPNYVYGTVDPVEEIGKYLESSGYAGLV